jgi:hypothetical protein
MIKKETAKQREPLVMQGWEIKLIKAYFLIVIHTGGHAIKEL